MSRIKKRKSLMTFDETLKFLNIKESYLRSLVFKKAIPYLKIGRLLRFNEDTLIDWMESNRVEPNEA
jgi:excisionase family DNA binding protein